MADTKVYLPKQQITRGVPGYKGKDVVVVDPDSGKQASADEDAKASKAATKSGAAKADKADGE